MPNPINTYQQLSVFIEALLIFRKKRGEENFSSNHEKLHNCFFSLKEKYPDYFKRLRFNRNGHYPISEDLDSILQDFQIAGIINKTNPEFKTILINNDNLLSERIKRRIPDIKDDTIESISKELDI
jgi:hypothetical protein